jgi:dGTPase
MTQTRYKQLSPELVARIEADRAAHHVNLKRATDADALRREPKRDKPTLWRPAYVRDIEKILHSPWYNRYADKTQVFSLYKNDDLTRRALHVQIVSRIARNIGAALGLNTDLIEAIALGHDIGHTPFGHSGERFLSALLHERTGRFFNHNVQSVRVLDSIFTRNISLACLSGILCHNGEFGKQEYRPQELAGFGEYDRLVEGCYLHKEAVGHLVPSTLEGCVVRICDMVAYVGKDRQDAARITDDGLDDAFEQRAVGQSNAQIINNISVDIIENSYGKDHIRLSDTNFKELEHIKRENYELIYDNDDVNRTDADVLEAMFKRLYERLYNDLASGDTQSLIYHHHINKVRTQRGYYQASTDYAEEEPNQIVVDYLASMTDDYFVDLHEHYFPGEEQIGYIPYFKG